jgi:hypothetical protein
MNVPQWKIDGGKDKHKGQPARLRQLKKTYRRLANELKKGR